MIGACQFAETNLEATRPSLVASWFRSSSKHGSRGAKMAAGDNDVGYTPGKGPCASGLGPHGVASSPSRSRPPAARVFKFPDSNSQGSVIPANGCSISRPRITAARRVSHECQHTL